MHRVVRYVCLATFRSLVVKDTPLLVVMRAARDKRKRDRSELERDLVRYTPSNWAATVVYEGDDVAAADAEVAKASELARTANRGQPRIVAPREPSVAPAERERRLLRNSARKIIYRGPREEPVACVVYRLLCRATERWFVGTAFDAASVVEDQRKRAWSVAPGTRGDFERDLARWPRAEWTAAVLRHCDSLDEAREVERQLLGDAERRGTPAYNFANPGSREVRTSSREIHARRLARLKSMGRSRRQAEADKQREIAEAVTDDVARTRVRETK